MNYSRVRAIEYFLPEKTVTNADLSRDNPGWDFKLIAPKTGIFSRHIAKDGQTALDLAVSAAEKLFKAGCLKKSSVDALVFCTQSPDFPLPASACIIQERLGLEKGILAFDFNQGCSGFIYGLAITDALIRSSTAETALLLCAETYSKYIASTDRTNNTVFGDGAAAIVVERADTAHMGPFIFGTDGSGKDKLIVRDGRLYMDGPSVFMFSMSRVPECVNALLSKAGKTMQDVDCFVFHQASKVVIDNLVRILSLDESKVFRGYASIGNTVSASIPIALKQASEGGSIKTGDLVMLIGFGVGFSWGATFLRW